MPKSVKRVPDSVPEASTSAIPMEVDSPATDLAPMKKDKSKKRKRTETERDPDAPTPTVKAEEHDVGTQAEIGRTSKPVNLPDELEIDLKAPTPLSKAEARQAKRDAKKAKKDGKENVEVEEASNGKAEDDRVEGEAGASPSTSEPPAKKAKKAKGDKDANGDSSDPPKPKRANSIWIGNLNFRSTSDALRDWLTKMIQQGTTQVGDIPPDPALVKALSKIKGGAEKAITRVNLPTKPGKGRGIIPEGKGFAYVDFASKEVQTFAVGLSERVFGGRKVLIKLGDDHAPTPDARTPKPLSIIAGTLPPASKLGANPPSSSLFVGNLAFDTNEVELREHVEREVGRGRGLSVGEDGEDEEGEAEEDEEEALSHASASGGESDSDAAVAEEPETAPAEASPAEAAPGESAPAGPTAKDILHGDHPGRDTKTSSKLTGLKKVRMPLFEDSGRCKGFAFLDFESPEFATFALAQRPLWFYKGRKLVLQYASESSTKRSLPAHKRNADAEKEAQFGNAPARGGSSNGVSRGGAGVGGRGRGGYRSSGDRAGDVEGSRPLAAAQTDDGEAGESTYMKRPERKPRPERPSLATGDGEGFGASRGKKWELSGRPRPGAALAMAKRQNVSIVAGQGKKVTFD